jgi:hypothetical protein
MTKEEQEQILWSTSEQEARDMVTFLPIMLKYLYGVIIWTWFMDKAKAEISGCYYNGEQSRVVSLDESYTKDMIADLDWDDDLI